MKALTGYSTNKDAFKAGVESAKMAKAKDAKIVFAYASCDYNLKELLKGIKSECSCPVIGNTSFTGVILPEGYVGGNEPFVGIMAISGKDIKVGVGFSARKDFQSARDAGQSAGEKAKKNSGEKDEPDVMYMTASPTEEEFYLKGISKVVGRVPTFGGSAADNTIEGNWSLFVDDKIAQEGVAVAFIYTKAPFANVFTGAYRTTKDAGIITKVEGTRRLVEIDGVPAVKKYAEWRKMPVEKFAGSNLLSETIVSPLGVKDRLGDLIAIRHPMFANEDLSMNVGANLAEGTAVIRMEATIDELISSVKTTLAELKQRFGKKAAFYHLVHCGGRRAGIGGRVNEIYEAIKSEIDGTPFIMEFTFGEYGYEDDGRNTTGGLMLSFTVFGE